ncbi:MAG: FtsQ-type POTRA domain-containing protein [Candidatus Cloacimonadales bacterium]|nr:FtsQ-type POTRA domain-containing protein [Candidatus Cloacimonadales bacterium]
MKRKRTGSSRYFVYFILSISLIAAVFIGIRTLFTKLSWFNIESIRITGNENLETEFLANLSLDFIGLNLYATSKRDILQKYENIVRIKDISITRIFPNKIKINILERKGLFYIRTREGELFPIDEDCIVLDNDVFYTEENLPVIATDISTSDVDFGKKIEDEFLNRILVFYYTVSPEYPDLFNNISEFYKKDNEIILVEANIGYKIVFGEDDLIEKIKKYRFLEQNRSFEKGKIVDLRYKDQLVIRADDN